MSSFELRDSKSISKLLARSSALSFLIRVSGAGLAFLLQIFLARIMGEDEYGIYSYVIAWMMIATIISPLGINKTAVKFIPSYISTKKFITLRIYVKWIVLFTFFSSITVMLVGIIGLYAIPSDLDDGHKLALMIGCSLISINALILLCMEVMRGLRKIYFSESANSIIRPLLIMGLASIWFFYTGEKPNSLYVLALNSGTGVLILIILLLLLKKLLKPFPNQQNTAVYSEKKAWFKTAIPLLFVTAGNIIQGKTNIIMIGAMIGTTDSGMYNAASNITQLIGLPLLSINMILAPVISQLHTSNQQIELQNAVKQAARWSFFSSVLLGSIVFILADKFLWLFGPNFIEQTTALQILLLAQIVSGAAGPAGYLLSMTGSQMSLAVIVISCAMLNIVLNFILIPNHGTNGAAIATFISIATTNVLMALLAIKHTRINPTIFSSLR